MALITYNLLTGAEDIIRVLNAAGNGLSAAQSTLLTNRQNLLTVYNRGHQFVTLVQEFLSYSTVVKFGELYEAQTGILWSTVSADYIAFYTTDLPALLAVIDQYNDEVVSQAPGSLAPNTLILDGTMTQAAQDAINAALDACLLRFA